jgi:formiminoglutamase
VIPRLFEGTLPVFNLGTNGGASCAPALQENLASILAGAKGFDHVVNGRFKGGWITRHYGRPDENVHAAQMELACRAYMDEEAPFAYDAAKAAQVQPVLRQVLEAMLAWSRRGRVDG